MKSLKKVLGGVGILVVTLVGAAVGGVVVRSLFVGLGPSVNDQTIMVQIQQASNQFNKQLPMMVDKDTRIDSTIAGPGKTLIYMFTIVSPNSSNLTQQDLDNYLGKEVRNGVCTANSMKVFINNGVQVRYIYRSNDGKVIGSIVVTSSDCKSGA